MVNFNRQQVDFVVPKLSKENQEAVAAICSATAAKILESAKTIADNQNLPRQAAMVLASTAVLNAATRSMFLAMGATPEDLKRKRKLIRECIHELVEKLHKEL